MALLSSNGEKIEGKSKKKKHKWVKASEKERQRKQIDSSIELQGTLALSLPALLAGLLRVKEDVSFLGGKRGEQPVFLKGGEVEKKQR